MNPLTQTQRATLSVFIVAFVLRVASNVLQWTPPSVFPLVPWQDFHIYVDWMAFMAHGSLPYSQVTSYTYTPLFAGFMLPAFLVAGSSGMAFIILASDAGVASLVFLILRKQSLSERVALAASLAYAVSPFVLFQEGTLLLSAEPMTFLAMLSVYFFRKGSPVASAVVMALAVMTRQEIAFALPAFGAWFVIRYRKQFAPAMTYFVMTVLGVSFPFLFIGTDYIRAIDYMNAAPIAYTGTANSTSHFSIPAWAVYDSLKFGAFALRWAGLLGMLLSVAIVAAWLTRRDSIELALASSLTVGLSLAMFNGLGMFQYYFVPVYALLAASANRWTWPIPLAFQISVLSFFPDGPTQLILALAACGTMLALNDASAATARRTA